MSVSLQGIEVSDTSTDDVRLAQLIWGPAGAGKTTLAATAPGDKLWLCFDPDGDLSLAGRDDIKSLRFYEHPWRTVVAQWRGQDPYGLTKYLTANTNIETVVFDSMTTYAHMALQAAVSSLGSNVTMELPSIAGYAYRNSLVLTAATTLLALTAKLKRNVIFITHEAAPETDDKGNTVSITMMLSTNLANAIGLRINEVWHLRDADNKRHISIRAHSRMKPMKTRLFDVTKATQFEWHYDALTNEGEGIADWWDAWKAGGGKKLAVPTRAATTQAKGGKRMPPHR